MLRELIVESIVKIPGIIWVIMVLVLLVHIIGRFRLRNKDLSKKSSSPQSSGE